MSNRCRFFLAGVNPAMIRQCAVKPKEIINLYHNLGTPKAEKLRIMLSEFRAIIQKRPMIPALKTIISRSYEDLEWSRVRPPLVELPSADANALLGDLEAHKLFADQLVT
ncbi:MAG: hypothetical protein O7C75_14470 [Verrucomicrobia bacterium]|nr:hypothetical protein [Verrucomicrobiota bacterium]